MFEFNPDGSLKLPGNLAKKKEEDTSRMKTQRCIKIRREIVSTYAPKKCALNITLSDAFVDTAFIENIFNNFKVAANTPIKIKKISDRQFEIEVGTDFRRCSDCNSLISRFKEYLDGNLIDEKGTCTFEGRKNFSYEDYF